VAALTRAATRDTRLASRLTPRAARSRDATAIGQGYG
jgi:hypothetical protein